MKSFSGKIPEALRGLSPYEARMGRFRPVLDALESVGVDEAVAAWILIATGTSKAFAFRRAMIRWKGDLIRELGELYRLQHERPTEERKGVIKAKEEALRRLRKALKMSRVSFDPGDELARDWVRAYVREGFARGKDR